MNEIEIWRTAKLLVDQHGKYALLEAGKRVEALFTKGDRAGCGAWRRIAAAVRWLQDDASGTAH
jgi:hypothetical protein